MPPGVVLALAAYALYACCDAIIKALGSGLSVPEIAFFATLFALVPAAFTKPKGEHWRQMFRLRHPWLMHIRGAVGALGNLCVLYAFTTIPLAEAYSLVFLSPLFVLLISLLVLHEIVPRRRWLFLGLSFVGMLLVVRPGFRELELGHLTATLGACTAATAIVILKHVALDETRVSLIGIPSLYIIGLNAVLMVPGFTVPDLSQVLLLLLVGGLGGVAHIFFIAATRSAPASQVAPTQYSQIVWAVALGAIFFAEVPDALAYAGLAIVLVSGVMNVISIETGIRVISRFGVVAGRRKHKTIPVPGSTTTEL
jgi:drug/metabolite transporter (DMT)-like permease